MAELESMLHQAEHTMKLLRKNISQHKRSDSTTRGENSDLEKLLSEVSTLEAEVKDMERMKSVSRMAHKMYGDIVPGELTHADVALQYKNLFKEEHRSLPKALNQVDKYRVWEMCADIMQKSYDESKTKIVARMTAIMGQLLNNDHKGLIDEDTSDVFKAFAILLENVKQRDIQEEVLHKITETAASSDILKETIEFVADVIFTVPPEQYYSALYGSISN